MYVKLSLRNMKRSMKDYAIYYFTLAFMVALLYSFLVLGFSGEIRALAENMTLLTGGVVFLSFFVAGISAFVVSYAVRFMLAKRKKEFAAYLLMGMENLTVMRLFVGENILIGFCAFFTGIFLGVGLSGVLTQIAMNIFEVPHAYQVHFSAEGVLCTFLLFLIMYGSGIVRAAGVIKRRKIIDLLYDHLRNEEVRAIRPGGYAIRIAAAGISVIAGSVLLADGIAAQGNSAALLPGAAALLVLGGIYSLYRMAPALFLFLYAKRKRWVYRDTNLYLLGSLRGKLQTAGRMLAVTALLFTFSLVTMFAGLVMGAGYKANIKGDYPYDVTVAIDTKIKDFQEIIDFLNQDNTVTDAVSYYLYQDEGVPVDILALSDYNRLRKQLGLDEKGLDGGQYLVQCEEPYRERVKEAMAARPEICLRGQVLTSGEQHIFTEPMEQARMVGTNGVAVVVPDETALPLQAGRSRLAVSLKNNDCPALRDALNRFVRREWTPEILPETTKEQGITISVTVRAWGIANSLSGFTVISFCGLYVGVALIILSCTLLAFEQLSAIDRTRREYEIMKKTGVSPSQRKRLLITELSVFFFIPAILPGVALILLAAGANKMFAAYILQANIIPLYAAVTFLVFAVFYALYFAATYSICKRALIESA